MSPACSLAASCYGRETASRPFIQDAASFAMPEPGVDWTSPLDKIGRPQPGESKDDAQNLDLCRDKPLRDLGDDSRGQGWRQECRRCGTPPQVRPCAQG